MNEETKMSGEWCVIELMGHQRMGGKVTEVSVAGAGFLRIDVPETAARPAFSRMVSPASVYAINPTTEQVARAVATTNPVEIVGRWELQRAAADQADLAAANRQLPQAEEDETYEEDDEADNEAEEPC